MFAGTYDDDGACDDTLGGRLSLGRETAGLSVADAAMRLGVMEESWQAWERDRDVPRGNRLTMMAGILGVSPTWLLTGRGAGPLDRTEHDPENLMQAFREASAEVAALTRRMNDIATSLHRHQNGQ